MHTPAAARLPHGPAGAARITVLVQNIADFESVSD